LLPACTLLLTVSCTTANELVADDSASPTPSSPSAVESPGAQTSPKPTARDAPTTAGSPTATTSPPRVGSCRRLQQSDLNSIVNDARDVPCRERHTAVTYDVGELPDPLADRATSPGDDRVEDAAQRICRRSFGPFLGGSAEARTLTSLRMTYFLPDSSEFAAGARWVRCEMFAYAAGGKLAGLPADLEGALDDDERADNLGTCSVVAPDHPRFQHIICTLQHSWRAVGFTRLAGPQATFPGPQALRTRASQRCEEMVREFLDTRDPFSYGYEVPSRKSWSGGNRLGYCWAQTAS